MMSKYAAAAIAILAYAAASPAFAQRGSGGDDVLVGGRTSYQTATSAPAQAGGGGGTAADDVIVDGRIITGENPASAQPSGGGTFFGIDDAGFKGGARAAGGDKPAKGKVAKASTAKGAANATPSRGGAKVAVGDVTGDSSQAGKGGSNHAGGVNVLMGDGSVRFDQPSGGSQAGARLTGNQPTPPPQAKASPTPVLLVIADQQDFYYRNQAGNQASPGLTDARPAGGTNAAMGDGSVRGIRGDIGGGGWNAPKGGSLGSLNSVGSIGQLAAPPGAPPAQATNNIRQLGLAAHNYNDAQGGGDVNGDGVGDVIVGTGNGNAHVKSGPTGGTTHVKVFDASGHAGPKTGGSPHVKAFSGADSAARGAGPAVKASDGNARAVSIGGAVATFTLDKQGKSTK